MHSYKCITFNMSYFNYSDICLSPLPLTTISHDNRTILLYIGTYIIIKYINNKIKMYVDEHTPITVTHLGTDFIIILN